MSRRRVVGLLFAAVVIAAAIITVGIWPAPSTVPLGRWEYIKGDSSPRETPWLTRQAEPSSLVKDADWLSRLPKVDARWTRFVARTVFRHKKTDGPVYYELEAHWPANTRGRVWLNGQELTGPCQGLFYDVIPGIDPNLLRDGPNVLTVAAEVYTEDVDAAVQADRRVKPLSMTLCPQVATELDLLIGPLFGWFDQKTFTVGMLANMPAEWSVTLDKPGFTVKPLRTEPGFYQTFEISRPPGDVEPLLAPLRPAVTVHARLPGRKQWQVERTGKGTVGPLGPRWSFVALGDNRTEPERWKSVITAAARRNPAFLVHSGDFVAEGRDFELWKDEFWQPAEPQLLTLPLYGVLGNHEDDSALFDKILTLHGTRNCWTQTQGPLLLIGIDGAQDWSPTSELYVGLETLLKGSRAKFILLFSHYPPLSSSRHSTLNEAGEYIDPDMRRAHKYLLPLCVKYHVTAYVAGHEHCYERTDFPGLTVLTSGGGGAPSYPQARDPETRNPYSKVYYAGLHYLFFTVAPDELRVQAFTPEGRLLDTLAWKPRP